MKDMHDALPMVEVELGQIVIRDASEQQFILLREVRGERGFPIVIGTSEACEIRRVVHGIKLERPLTHELTFETIRALGAEIERVDIVDLRNNTFFAQLVLRRPGGEVVALVDARPSDALALALRARCRVRVAEHVLEVARTDKSGPDPLPPSSTDEPEQGQPES
jgi:uncharacterized protein